MVVEQVNEYHVAEVRRMVMAAVETGNIARAGMIVREVEAEYPDIGQGLRREVQDAYDLELEK